MQAVSRYVFVTEKGRVLLVHNDPSSKSVHFKGIPPNCYGFIESDDGNDKEDYDYPYKIAKELLGFTLTKKGTINLHSTAILPAFSVREIKVTHYIVVVSEEDIAHSQLYWEHPKKIIEDYKRFSLILTPETLDVIQSLTGKPQPTKPLAFKGFDHKLTFLPSIKCIPTPSSTIPPFDHTNLIIIKRQKEALIVDPGTNVDLIKDILGELYNKKLDKLLVFITHHHHDHTEGLESVEKILGKDNVEVLAHPLSLSRMSDCIGGLKCAAVNHGDKIQVGDYILEVIGSPGHTSGSISLYHPKSGALFAGDHVVGFGSSVLDVTSGGDMSEYLNTCNRMLSLSPLKIIFPAHGPPNYEPKPFLQKFIDHRLDRERSILKVLAEHNSEQVPIDLLLERVYSDVPKAFWSRAISNLQLHIKKLVNDKVITNDRIIMDSKL
eukprot:TRINITY_DN4680_c0_g1_i7.p1 TRINITY_DN4680_c0_g1~~TRINITY_DN4680_c0_g1_i7.p1  ORF type:complete len:436 (+),score=72.33 TRINITY_DN4680_c0_g1_i7:134-1441(+)